MKMFKGSALIIAIGLIASFFSCSFGAMIARRPQGANLSMQKRQAVLAGLKQRDITLSKIATAPHKEGLVDILSCKKDEFFVYEQGSLSHLGVCVSGEVVKVSKTLNNMITDIIENMAIATEDQSKSIPLNFSIAVIKNTFDILKIYEQYKSRTEDIIARQIKQAISGYSREQLVDVVNCIHYLDCPKDVQNVCLDEIKNKYKGGVEAIASNQNLNLDVRTSFIVQPAVDCLTNLLEKKNMQATRMEMLQDYSKAQLFSTSAALNFDGSKIVEGQFNGFVIRDASGNILLDQAVGLGITAVAMSPDGTKVVVGGANSTLQIWDVNTGVHTHNLVGHGGAISSIAFSRDGTKVVSGCLGVVDTLKIWSVATGAQITSFPFQASVVAVEFNSDGTKIVAGYEGGGDDIIIWDAATGGYFKYYKSLGNNVLSVSFSPDDKKILCVGAQGHSSKAFLIDVDKGSKIQLTEERTLMKELRSGFLGAFTGEVECIPTVASFARDGRAIIIGELYGIRMFDIDNNYNTTQEIYLKNEGWRPLLSVAVSFDGRKVILGYKDPRNSPYTMYRTFAKCTLWTDEDEKLINRLKSGTSAEVNLIFKLCSELKKSGSVQELNKVGTEIFQRFPAFMQQSLSSIFWPAKKGWLSDWW